MDPKFVKLEDAAKQLNISPDRLNALREDGKLRAYRDGSSWKFRREEIDKMATEGVPAVEAEESSLNLDLDSLSLGDEMSLEDEPQPSVEEADQPAPSGGPQSSSNGKSAAAKSSDEPNAADDDESLELAPLDSSQSDLELADDDLDLTTGSSADLALDLDDESPTEQQAAKAQDAEQPAASEAAAAESSLDLEPEPGSGDDPESILLSENELGESADRPPSTIIGKAELDDASDLELVTEETDQKQAAASDAGMSDVRLADLDDLQSGAEATGELPPSGEGSGDFDDIEELEIDLEAESSRILSPEDVQAAQAAASSQAQQKAPETSDLQLDTDDDYSLASSSDAGLSGLSGISDDNDQDDLISGSQIDLEESAGGSEAGLTGLSALELDEGDDDGDDDFVLGDGSDLTLSAADSGINLSPADSGLSLDDASVELTGSAIGSEIDFGEASGLVSDEPGQADFELTPLAEDAGGEEDDDSSQVIALDAFEEQQEADDLLGGGGAAAAAPAAAGFGQAAMVPRSEAQFSGWNIFFLSLCLVLLTLCGIMVLDVLRSMWSWSEPYQVNSSIIEGLSGFLFP